MDPMNPPAPASPARFGAYLYTQFCSAFNDNVHFFAISLFLTYTVSHTKEEAGRWQAIVGAAFVFPFILFSPLAGTIADRFEKRTVLIWAKWTEVIPMTVSFISTFLPAPLQYYGLVLGIFLMETRSAFFSPPKYGILPEIVASDRLVRANGILQMLTMVAIVSGEAIAGTLLHDQGMQATIGCCLGLAVVGSLLATWIPAGATGDRTRRLQLNPVGKVWGTLREMKSDRMLLLTAITLSCFWMVSAIFRSNVPLFGKLVLEIDEAHASRLMAFVSVGIGIGAGLASVIKNAEKSMGVVLPGVAGMAVSSILVGALGHTFLASGLMLAVLGLFGGLYLVPQTTIFQARSPAKQRGEYLAVQNFVNYLFMLGAALVFEILTNRLHLTPREIFITVGVGLALLGVAQAATMGDLVLGPLKALLVRRTGEPGKEAA
jgi:acyl-[acyl-carrier-protein]-phospholipid O-acyltransferase/long-chain-fatty-acid--[acyl-carrier-protein] ligase